MNLPNFFVVGTQKGGTTSLQHYLEGHPDIYLPAQKETKFFVDDTRFCKGIESYEKAFYSCRSGEKAIGEIDPDYMYFEQALIRIHQQFDLKNMKIIFSLRNPVDRAFSHYLMSYRRGVEPLNFEEAIDQEEYRIKKDYLSNMHYSYIERGRYFKQISRFFEFFDASQMHFVLFEHLISRPDVCLKEILNFLEVDATYTPNNLGENFHPATVPRSMNLLKRINQKDAGFEKKIIRKLIPWKSLRHKIRQKVMDLNQSKSRRMQLNPATRQRLLQLYAHDNAQLTDLIDVNLDNWRK